MGSQMRICQDGGSLNPGEGLNLICPATCPHNWQGRSTQLSTCGPADLVLLGPLGPRGPEQLSSTPPGTTKSTSIDGSGGPAGPGASAPAADAGSCSGAGMSWTCARAGSCLYHHQQLVHWVAHHHPVRCTSVLEWLSFISCCIRHLVRRLL